MARIILGLNNCFIARVCLSTFLFLCLTEAADLYVKVFDVRKYGARGDGKTDNTKAFLSAWKEACEWKGRGRVYIPVGRYLVGEILFMGPCKGSLSFFIKGDLKAPANPFSIKGDTWIAFRYIDHLVVTGGGTLDGQGPSAWPFNDCHKNPNCRPLATTMAFQFVKESKLKRIKSLNSKNTHFSFFGCENMKVSNLIISAPANSPNTDGIKIGMSNNIEFSSLNIGTGDDCIAMLSGISNINISKVQCGPGHGISIGSLGKNPGERNIERITIKDSTISHSSDGLRIKTWADSISSIVVSDIIYDNIIINNVGTPINIDQQYCPYPPCNLKPGSTVQIKDVTFRNIRGTTRSKTAVNLKCSKRFPCKNIVLHDVNLSSRGPEGPARTLCEYVNGRSYGKMIPPACF